MQSSNQTTLQTQKPVQSTSQTQQPVQSTLQTQQPIEPTILNQSMVGYTIAGLLIFGLPSCLVLGTFLYRKYSRAYRATVRLRQIQALERLWQMSPKK